jgi:DNA-binding SARP family transcriptional activator
VRYEVLGSLRVVDENSWSVVSAPKMSVLLATLLVRSNQVVSVEQLITEIWGGSPPTRATAAVHVYVSQLRKFLRRPGQTRSPIVTHPPGYLLRPGDDELDVETFQRLTEQGREHARNERHAEASACFDTALGLWRGQVLADLRNGPIVSNFVRWLEEIQLECVEDLVASRMSLGRHRELVGKLYTLVNEYPLHEAFYRQLMLALYRSGRRADALRVYHGARDTLRAELGLEPCPSLRQLQGAILAADESLELPLAG